MIDCSLCLPFFSLQIKYKGMMKTFNTVNLSFDYCCHKPGYVVVHLSWTTRNGYINYSTLHS